MRQRLRKLNAAICTALVGSTAAATTVNLPEPGYLLIDSAYYGYGLRDPADTQGVASLAALGAEGFHLKTVLDLPNCRRAGGGLPAANDLVPARFRASDSATLPDLPGLPVTGRGAAPLPSVQLLACAGATVVVLGTADGDTVCDGALGFPFQRGECAALDANDPGFVFFDSFSD